MGRRRADCRGRDVSRQALAAGLRAGPCRTMARAASPNFVLRMTRSTAPATATTALPPAFPLSRTATAVRRWCLTARIRCHASAQYREQQRVHLRRVGQLGRRRKLAAPLRFRQQHHALHVPHAAREHREPSLRHQERRQRADCSNCRAPHRFMAACGRHLERQHRAPLRQRDAGRLKHRA